jgi:hypothetical protein
MKKMLPKKMQPMYGSRMRLAAKVVALSVAALLAGCAAQQLNSSASTPVLVNGSSSGSALAPPSPAASSPVESQPLRAPVESQAAPAPIESRATSAPVRPLPFKGRLSQGDPDELPPAVAMSLADKAPVTFIYREELTHDEYHIPLAVSALDPVTYFGAPLGDYGVTAFASLAIINGSKVIADYTAKAHVTKSFTLYSEPTHAELERSARAAVRDKIDQKLYRDFDLLAQSVAGASAPIAKQSSK